MEFSAGDNYSDVDRIANEQGLLWDGYFGSPYGIEQLVDPAMEYAKIVKPWERLFDHTIRFKPQGKGNKRPVMAITSPYQRNDAALLTAANECARALGLFVRVGDEQDRVYVIDGTVPILFWRPDLHTLKG